MYEASVIYHALLRNFTQIVSSNLQHKWTVRWALWSYLVTEVSESQRLNNLPSKISEYQIWNLISVTSDFKVCILSALLSLTPHGANKLFNQKYDSESNIDLHFVWVFAEYTKGLNTNTLIVWKLPSLKYWLSNVVALDSVNALFKNTVCFFGSSVSWIKEWLCLCSSPLQMARCQSESILDSKGPDFGRSNLTMNQTQKRNQAKKSPIWFWFYIRIPFFKSAVYVEAGELREPLRWEDLH